MRSHLPSSNQSPLQFDDVRIAFLGVFSLPLKKNMNKEYALELLKSAGFKANWNPPHSKDFETVEGFLLPEEIAKQYFRLGLGDLEVSMNVLNGKSNTTTTLSVEVFLTVYPQISMGILLFNVMPKFCDVDQVIFLKQSIHNRFNLRIRSYTPFARPQLPMSLLEAMREYVKALLLAFNINVKNTTVIPSTCIEIRSLRNVDKTMNPEEIFQSFPQQIYGMLVGDEGWRYVPQDVARTKMDSRWGTRDFAKVVYFADSVVMINFEDQRSCGYRESQKGVREKFGCVVEEYFTTSPKIAGLNHGPLLMLENTFVQYFIVQEALAKTAKTRIKSIRGLLREREDLLDALGKLSSIKIPEMGALGRRVQEAMHLSKSMEELEKRLDEIERTLLIKYNQKINLGLILLAIITLFLGILELLIQFGFLTALS